MAIMLSVMVNVIKMDCLNSIIYYNLKIINYEIHPLSSKIDIATPEAAPEPASPMKWPLPMLLANREAPT